MELTSENVDKIIRECLFKQDENTANFIDGSAVMWKIGYHPERLKSNEENIKSMLSCLPDDFMKSKGGGMTFLNACMDRNGKQWADLHETVDKLVSLGIASGQMSFCLPREMWDVMPGGMPYIVVNQ